MSRTASTGLPLKKRGPPTWLSLPRNAAHIQELLPPDRTVSHRSEDFNVTVATRILDRLGILESLLAEGRYHAFEVAFALGEISDGEYAEWLSEMLGASARTHPTALLKSMKSNRIRLSDSCRFGVAADPDKFDTPAKYIVEIEARRESVAGISDADLAVPRECLCMEFDRVLERR